MIDEINTIKLLCRIIAEQEDWIEYLKKENNRLTAEVEKKEDK